MSFGESRRLELLGCPLCDRLFDTEDRFVEHANDEHEPEEWLEHTMLSGQAHAFGIGGGGR